MDAELYRTWLQAARRLTSQDAEAEDLLQEALLVAWSEDRCGEWSEEDRRWFHGVLRNQARQAARGAGRRRRREQQGAVPEEIPGEPPAEEARPLAELLDSLPRAVRQVATLVLHGLERAEIQQALEISDTAFRQRLTSLRRLLAEQSPGYRQEALARAYLQRRRGASAHLDLGLLRRALATSVRQRGGLGTHDPDGHLLIFSRPGSRPAPRRQPPSSGSS